MEVVLYSRVPSRGALKGICRVCIGILQGFDMGGSLQQGHF